MQRPGTLMEPTPTQLTSAGFPVFPEQIPFKALALEGVSAAHTGMLATVVPQSTRVQFCEPGGIRETEGGNDSDISDFFNLKRHFRHLQLKQDLPPSCTFQSRKHVYS